MGLLGLIFFYIGISMGWLYVRILHDDLALRLKLITHLIGIHGRRSRVRGRANRTMRVLEEGEQMGLYHWRDRWLLCWPCGVACNHIGTKREYFGRHGKSSFLLTSSSWWAHNSAF